MSCCWCAQKQAEPIKPDALPPCTMHMPAHVHGLNSQKIYVSQNMTFFVMLVIKVPLIGTELLSWKSPYGHALHICFSVVLEDFEIDLCDNYSCMQQISNFCEIFRNMLNFCPQTQKICSCWTLWPETELQPHHTTASDSAKWYTVPCCSDSATLY
jgi:hypothetical protein